MRLRRERDDQVEIRAPPRSSSSSNVIGRARDVDADLVHGRDRERIELALAHAGRGDVERGPNSCLRRPAAIGERTELSPQANSTACGRPGRAPSPCTPHPFQCSTQISVNSRRAVSKSSLTLRLSAPSGSCEPSSCSARRPMSSASMRSGVAVRIAS